MKLSLDYLAGIIDGEGTITLSRKHAKDTWRTPEITVTSTTLELLTAIVETCGGHICNHKPRQPHHNHAWSWRLEGRKAIEFCRKIAPRLVLAEKKRRAKLIVRDYLKYTPRNGKYTETQKAAKAHFEWAFFNGGSSASTRVKLDSIARR